MKLAILEKGLNGLYHLLTKLFPVNKKKITYCTNRSEKLTGNLAYLYNELKADDAYVSTIICFNFERSLSGRLRYLFYSLLALYHLATSRVFIVDDYFLPLYCLKNKQKNNTIIQVWHAIGHLKKYGLSIPANQTKRIKPHINYDYVLANAASDIPALTASFAVEPEQVIVTGAPRVDGLVSAFKAPKLAEKQLPQLMYAPTYRNGSGSDPTYQYVNDFIREAIHSGLAAEYQIWVSLHPYIKLEQLEPVRHKNIHVFQDNQKSSQLLGEISCLVTDYSSILLDYAFFEKPLFIYAPDYEEYLAKVGFFVDYQSYIDTPFYQEPQSLIKAIKERDKLNLAYVRELKQDNFTFFDTENSARAAAFVKTIMQQEI